MQTYLRLAECLVGLILNFNGPVLKHGIRRVANKRCLTAEELAMLTSAGDEELEACDSGDAADRAPDE